MAFLAVTYTFSNGSVASATEVNTNFQDVVDANSDGTIDYNIGALSCAGTATFNGNVAIGNASGDDLTITASLASNLAVKTQRSYAIGSATNGLSALYLGMNDTYSLGLIAPSSGAAAAYNITLPATVPTTGFVLTDTDGAGTLAWQSKSLFGINGSGGTSGVTLTTLSKDISVFTPSTGITVKLDSSFAVGRKMSIINNGSSDALITVTANDDTVIGYVTVASYEDFICVVGSPSTNTSWYSRTSLAASTKLGLKVYSHGTSYNGSNSPTITLSSGGGTLSSVSYSKFIPKQLVDGSWVMTGFFEVALSSAARTVPIFAIAGTDIPSGTEIAISGCQLDTSGAYSTQNYMAPSTGSGMRAIIAHQSATTTLYVVSFHDIPQASKPTWAY